jgi:hypothetical protein
MAPKKVASKKPKPAAMANPAQPSTIVHDSETSTASTPQPSTLFPPSPITRDQTPNTSIEPSSSAIGDGDRDEASPEPPLSSAPSTNDAHQASSDGPQEAGTEVTLSQRRQHDTPPKKPEASTTLHDVRRSEIVNQFRIGTAVLCVAALNPIWPVNEPKQPASDPPPSTNVDD